MIEPNENELEREDRLLAELTAGRGRRIERRNVQLLRDERGNRCRRCGSRVKLEFAHVQATALQGRSRGSIHRYYDIKKNPGAYELLCRDCHRDFDKRGGYSVFFGLLFVAWLNGEASSGR
jgi:hypothetical protein